MSVGNRQIKKIITGGRRKQKTSGVEGGKVADKRAGVLLNERHDSSEQRAADCTSACRAKRRVCLLTSLFS